MDTNLIKNQTIVELLHKTTSLARQQTKGVPSPYCWDEVLQKFSAIELLEDADAEESTKQCVTFYLNDTMDANVVNTIVPTITSIYIPIYEKHYRGTIATLNQMNSVAAQYKDSGWWWGITGTFTYLGTTYSAGDEIYWDGDQFQFWNARGGSGTGTTWALDVPTGALVGDVPKRVYHGMHTAYGYERFTFICKDVTNNILVDQLYADPENPDNFIIRVGIDVPEGYTVTVIAI